MKIAIMQPYLFPYIGYFQLVAAVDVFVLYDDVRFMKKGWINRNRILLNGSEHMFSLPCLHASQNRLIKDIEVDWSNKEVAKLRTTLETAYRKAPFFDEVYPLVKGILHNTRETTIADVASGSIKQVCSYLDIPTVIERSSQGSYQNSDLCKGERLVDIVLKKGGEQYINAIGGAGLYTKDSFARHGIELNFIKSLPVTYPQPCDAFVPWLSIIDVLMHNRKETISNFLNSYELL